MTNEEWKPRSEDEILAKFNSSVENWGDPSLFMALGGGSDLLDMLGYEHVKAYYKVEESEWHPDENTEKALISKIVKYLDFAFEKAHGQRGISASRSINHFQMWLWLLRDDELYNFACNDGNYPNYGLPILEKIKQKYSATIGDNK